MKKKTRIGYGSDEMDCLYLLVGAILRQAYDDVADLKYYQYQQKHTGKLSRWRQSNLDNSIRECKDAHDFFETDRLDNFISCKMIHLNTSYLRRIYKGVRDGKIDGFGFEAYSAGKNSPSVQRLQALLKKKRELYKLD